MQSIYGVGSNLHRCLKTKSGVSAHDVVVNGFWNTDNGKPKLFVEHRTNRE
jgi:hypothetical protein